MKTRKMFLEGTFWYCDRIRRFGKKTNDSGIGIEERAEIIKLTYLTGKGVDFLCFLLKFGLQLCKKKAN